MVRMFAGLLPLLCLYRGHDTSYGDEGGRCDGEHRVLALGVHNNPPWDESGCSVESHSANRMPGNRLPAVQNCLD